MELSDAVKKYPNVFKKLKELDKTALMSKEARADFKFEQNGKKGGIRKAERQDVRHERVFKRGEAADIRDVWLWTSGLLRGL